MKTPMKKISAARTALILENPFFGTLALRLSVVEDPTCPTAWTDGTRMGFNPDFVDALPLREVQGLIAHEVLHCALGHPWRRGSRDRWRWNVATDYLINEIVTGAGMVLPEGALVCPTEFKGRGAEWVYDRLPVQDDGGGDGNGNGPFDDVRDAGSSAGDDDGSGQTLANEWVQAAQQAAQVARMRGDLPGSLERFVEHLSRSRVNWRSVLLRFAQDASRSDYTWRRPNPRYLHLGTYLPHLHETRVGEIAVVVDTSGSIDAVTLSKFEAEINAIVDSVRPGRVLVLYVDTRVAKTEEFFEGEPVQLRAHGGGGTDFRPAFAHIDEAGEIPACLIYLTDMYGAFPDEPPAYPVLWAKTTEVEAPWGEEVEITD